MKKAEDFKWLDRVYHLFHLGSYLCLSGALTDCFLPLKCILMVVIYMVADNSFYRPASAILTVTYQNDSRHNVKTVLPIINTLILLENDQQLLSQS